MGDEKKDSKGSDANENSSEDKHVFFHYTDRDSSEEIKKSGFIKESTDTARDAAYGKGVYGTTMGPNRSSKDISRNNYDDGAKVYESQERIKKTEVAYECHVPKENVKLYRDNKGRNITVHQGNVSLKDVKKIHEREVDNEKKIV